MNLQLNRVASLAKLHPHTLIMPRKAFVADLQDAIREFQCENVSSLAPGEEDGTITFNYQIHGESQGTTIQAIVPGKIVLDMGLIIKLSSCRTSRAT